MKDRFFLREDPETTVDNGEYISCDDGPNIGFIVYQDQTNHKIDYIYEDAGHTNSHYRVRQKYSQFNIDRSNIVELIQGRIWTEPKIAATYQVESRVIQYSDVIEKLFRELDLRVEDFRWDFCKRSDDDYVPWPAKTISPKTEPKTLSPEAQKKLDDLIQMMHVATPDEKEKIKAQIRSIQNVYGIEIGEIERRIRASLEKKAQAAGAYDNIAQSNFYKGSIAETTFRVYNKSLDPKIWNEMSLDPKVRASLLKIAQDFYKSTDLTAPIYDVLFIGSSANFNWTPTSDVDLHVVIDITQVGVEPGLARSFMDGLAAKWNTSHEIEIKGHPVEVYLQDIREKNSTAVLAREGAAIYSVLKNGWVKQPNSQKFTIDKDKIKQKYHAFKKKISDFILKKDVDNLKQLMKNIRNYRDAGLTKSGEFGTENLVFKALRYTGELTKLKDAINSIYDKSMSVDEFKKKVSEGKFNPLDSKELQFVTFGGLSLNKQNGYKSIDEPTFHAPPAKKGIYAFVWPYIENFLLGGDSFVNPKKRGKGQRNRIKYVKDKDGNVVTNNHPDYEQYSEKPKNWSMHGVGVDDIKLYRNHARKKFSYEGNLWHHLDVPEFSVLDRKGSWVKTDMVSYKIALKKDIHGLMNSARKYQGHKDLPKSVRFCAKDHLEVFIDEKI